MMTTRCGCSTDIRCLLDLGCVLVMGVAARPSPTPGIAGRHAWLVGIVGLLLLRPVQEPGALEAQPSHLAFDLQPLLFNSLCELLALLPCYRLKLFLGCARFFLLAPALRGAFRINRLEL